MKLCQLKFSERNKLIAAIVQSEKHEIANDGENSSDVTVSDL